MPELEQFTQFQQKIKMYLSKALRKRAIKPRDVLLILTIFSKAETLDQLQLLIELFLEDYKFFRELIDEEKYHLKADFEEHVQHFVSEIVQKNPLLAAEISAEALKKDSNIESLKTKYPEFKNFLETYQNKN